MRGALNSIDSYWLEYARQAAQQGEANAAFKQPALTDRDPGDETDEPCGCDVCLAMAEALSEDVTILVVDLRGFGTSPAAYHHSNGDGTHVSLSHWGLHRYR